MTWREGILRVLDRTIEEIGALNRCGGLKAYRHKVLNAVGFRLIALREEVEMNARVRDLPAMFLSGGSGSGRTDKQHVEIQTTDDGRRLLHQEGEFVPNLDAPVSLDTEFAPKLDAAIKADATRHQV